MARKIGTTHSGKPIHDVTHTAYTSHHRMPKWNIEPNALREPKLLKRTLREYTREDHEDAAEAHDRAAEVLTERHRRAQEAAERKYGDDGNPYAWVSGGVREHWPRDMKTKIGNMSRKVSAHNAAREAHHTAMRFRR